MYNETDIMTRLLTADIRTPCYVIDEKKLRENCEVLKSVQGRTGCRILLAQKAFSNYDFYPLLSEYLSGTEASGLYEARLGCEMMKNKECHVFCAAYREDEFKELLSYAGHIVFNSPTQLKKYGAVAKAHGRQVGLRINPECSTQEGHEIYDPCSPASRLGTTREQWDELMDEGLTDMLDGLHFHTLCEQNSDALEKTLEAVEEKFSPYLKRVKWLNMGGGHHITRDDYDIELLCRLIEKMRDKYSLQIYLEPGEAVALNAGYLVTEVLDIVKNGKNRIAILDMSPACHTPDVIEMPYRPPLYGSVEKSRHSYILAGPTCLAGDVVGEYCFERELNIGDRLIFGDMAIYSTCKNNTFNGMPLPTIYKACESGRILPLAAFGYDDFKYRLGTR